MNIIHASGIDLPYDRVDKDYALWVGSHPRSCCYIPNIQHRSPSDLLDLIERQFKDPHTGVFILDHIDGLFSRYGVADAYKFFSNLKALTQKYDMISIFTISSIFTTSGVTAPAVEKIPLESLLVHLESLADILISACSVPGSHEANNQITLEKTPRGPTGVYTNFYIPEGTG